MHVQLFAFRRHWKEERMVSNVMEELYRVKQELAAEYSTFAEFAKALLKRQEDSGVAFEPL